MPFKETVKENTSITKHLAEEKKLQDKIIDEKPAVQVSKQTKMLKAGKCIITVYKARNIEKKGMFGKADPYLK